MNDPSKESSTANEQLNPSQQGASIFNGTSNNLLSLQREVETLRQQLEEFKRKESAAKDQHDIEENVFKKNKALRELLQQVQQENEKDKEQKTKLKKQLLELKKLFQSPADKYKEDLDDEEETIEFLKARIPPVLAKNKELEKEIADVRQKLVKFEEFKNGELEVLKKRLKSQNELESIISQSQVQRPNVELLKLESQVKSLVEQQRRAEQEATEHFKSIVESARSGVFRKDEGNSKAVYEKQLEIDALRSELTQSEGKIALLKTEINVLKQEAASFELVRNQLTYRDKELSQLREELDRIKSSGSQVKSLELLKHLELRNERIQNLEQRVRETEEQIKSLREENIQLKDDEEAAGHTVDLIRLLFANLFSEMSSVEEKFRRVEDLHRILSRLGNVNKEIEQLILGSRQNNHAGSTVIPREKQEVNFLSQINSSSI